MSDLTGALTQIVSNLMEIINVSKQANLEPTEGRVKKTSDMTYHDFLRKVLAGKDPLPVTSKKMGYRLQEDLQLLLELSDHNQISVKTFENIANSKKINRTSQSLRSRYSDYLHKIEQKQMKRIVSWIEREGLQGYLIFENGQMTIQRSESNQLKKQQAQKKRQRPLSLEKESKKTQKVGKQAKLSNVPMNCKQLNDVLRIYSKMVNVPIPLLLEKLDQVSGDLTQLDQYIQTKDSRILWSAQQDQILAKGGPQLEILRRYRGNGVEKRKKYLGL